MDVALLLRDRYETTYGIYDHDNPNPQRPLALVGMHPKEDSCLGSLLYERLEHFAENDVAKHFGLSLKEFLEFPTDVCSKILEISLMRKTKEGVATQGILNELQQQETKGK